MEFTTWIKKMTGLSLYDFRVLDMDGTANQQIKELFTQWITEYSLTLSTIQKAVEAIKEEGFDLKN